MFESLFGLRENPFAAGHQSRFVFPSPEHQQALAHLRFGIENREPFVLITGEVGTGKTTALFGVLEEWTGRVQVALVTNSALTRSELLEEICLRLGFRLPPGSSKPQVLVQLERHLLALQEHGDRAILLLDEAQNLDRELLEEIRLLSNLEFQGSKLLQVFLVGQPELEARLARPELRQLRQRISVRYRLKPLSAADSERYIHHRITVAGGYAHDVFPADACAEVYRLSHGIPREINQICAQAMLGGYVEDARPVRPEHVRAAAAEIEFESVMSESGAAEVSAPPAQPPPAIAATVASAVAAPPPPPTARLQAPVSRVVSLPPLGEEPMAPAPPGPVHGTGPRFSPSLAVVEKVIAPEALRELKPSRGGGDDLDPSATALKWLLAVAAVAAIATSVVLYERLAPDAKPNPSGAAIPIRERAVNSRPPEALNPSRAGREPGAGVHARARQAPPGTSQPLARTNASNASAPRPAPRTATAAPRRVTTPAAAAQRSSAPNAAMAAPAAGASSGADAPVAPAAPQRTETATPTLSFAVAVGTFLDEGRAEAERSRLAATTGMAASVRTVTADSVSRFELVLGLFRSHDAAERAAIDLIDRGLVDEARVVAQGQSPATR